MKEGECSSVKKKEYKKTMRMEKLRTEHTVK